MHDQFVFNFYNRLKFIVYKISQKHLTMTKNFLYLKLDINSFSIPSNIDIENHYINSFFASVLTHKFETVSLVSILAFVKERKYREGLQNSQ